MGLGVGFGAAVRRVLLVCTVALLANNALATVEEAPAVGKADPGRYAAVSETPERQVSNTPSPPESPGTPGAPSQALKDTPDASKEAAYGSIVKTAPEKASTAEVTPEKPSEEVVQQGATPSTEDPVELDFENATLVPKVLPDSGREYAEVVGKDSSKTPVEEVKTPTKEAPADAPVVVGTVMKKAAPPPAAGKVPVKESLIVPSRAQFTGEDTGAAQSGGDGKGVKRGIEALQSEDPNMPSKVSKTITSAAKPDAFDKVNVGADKTAFVKDDASTNGTTTSEDASSASRLTTLSGDVMVMEPIMESELEWEDEFEEDDDDDDDESSWRPIVWTTPPPFVDMAQPYVLPAAEQKSANNESAKVSTPQSPTVKAPDATIVTAPDATTVKAPDAATVKAPDATIVTAPDATTVKAPDATTVKAPDATTVKAPDATTVKAPESTIVTAAEPRRYEDASTQTDPVIVLEPLEITNEPNKSIGAESSSVAGSSAPAKPLRAQIGQYTTRESDGNKSTVTFVNRYGKPIGAAYKVQSVASSSSEVPMGTIRYRQSPDDHTYSNIGGAYMPLGVTAALQPREYGTSYGDYVPMSAGPTQFDDPEKHTYEPLHFLEENDEEVLENQDETAANDDDDDEDIYEAINLNRSTEEPKSEPTTSQNLSGSQKRTSVTDAYVASVDKAAARLKKPFARFKDYAAKKVNAAKSYLFGTGKKVTRAVDVVVDCAESGCDHARRAKDDIAGRLRRGHHAESDRL
ncbi:Proteoglycan 4 [Babesia bigemina]|uniref:Proteoglycan 4 n=1 Tax=Babesia bigemina TaxID=5866 RepID=A0A061D5F5_BABBI|nr:Proteoglycan 4 [Babesia bigemina]CDR95946.1 Proteoglycan 4 [Babesia bigemina]|eukprot:XP_012768132.1 Proteoglycan 4 [Babesia bigemina]